jgi:hypothetical protein
MSGEHIAIAPNFQQPTLNLSASPATTPDDTAKSAASAATVAAENLIETAVGALRRSGGEEGRGGEELGLLENWADGAGFIYLQVPSAKHI